MEVKSRYFKASATVIALFIMLFSGANSLAQDTPIYEEVVVQKPDTAWNRGVSIRTNLFYAGSGTPNLGLEIPVSKHVSLGGNFGLKPWPRFLAWDNDKMKEKKWKHLLAVPELRIWPKEMFEGWFFGLDLIYTHYNVAAAKFPFGLYKKVKDSRLEGDWMGVGLFFGHSWWLSQRWRLELEAGAALGYNDAKQYECGYCGTEIGKDKGWGVVPKLGLNLAYNFVKRKGMIDEVIRIPQPKAPANVSSPAAFNPVLSDVTPRKGIADEIAETNPFLKPIGQYKPYTPDRVLRKEKGALYVNFEVGKHILKYNFRNNGEVLDKIVDITSKVMADARNQVSKIQIVGLASIEGGYQLNQRLALNRAVALQKYLQERINIPDEMFDAQGGAEAWSEFKDQVNDLLLEGGNSELNPKELQQIIDIINSEGNLDRREAKIKSLNKGRTFQILKRHILADQRNSGYLVIYFDYVDEVAKKINSAIGMLESGNDKEALDVLQKVSDDPRSANALATALYKNGREAEAIALLEKAIAQGGEGAVGAKENLESIRSIQKQRAEYEQYQKDLQEYNKQMEDFNRRVNQLKQSK